MVVLVLGFFISAFVAHLEANANGMDSFICCAQEPQGERVSVCPW